MRIEYSLKAGILFLAVILATGQASGTSSKYKRSGSKTGTSDDSASPAASPSPSSGETSGPAGEKKVDLTDLENRYWSSKDTEFKVVQNRLYTKAKRYSIAPAFGNILNDNYTSNYNVGFIGNYYFSERTGVEVAGWKTFSSNADFVGDFGKQFGVIPDHNMHQGFLGVAYNYIPIYAKLSLLDKKILYFDMGVSAGVGATFLSASTFASPPTFVAPTATSQTLPTLTLDVTQQVFINEKMALRLDLRNHFYQENIYDAGNGSQKRTKNTYESSLMLGLSFFFGMGANQQQQ